MAGAHMEFCFKARQSDTVIVFVHGILGSPSQFSYMIDKLGGIFSVENLLLPGHGGTMKEFAASNMAEWQAYVDERILKLQDEYQNIILAAHSMGCLLSVQAALRYPEKIRGLFLMAMPLVIRVRSPYVGGRMISAFQKNASAEISAALTESNSVRTGGIASCLGALPRFAELYFKCRKTRELVSKLKLPMIVVNSEYDETVSHKSLRYVDKMPNVRILTARASGHFYYPKETKELLSDALLHFIGELTETAGIRSV
ncbi:MAG: alpha/beta hydrolase [Clostridiales bacterium]|jgi:carboxylesterase|nr:alpha/beta hydrolase [Clostridiales bacterium]